MISQGNQNRANPENGVRYRVAECRKRLRNNRTTHREITQHPLEKVLANEAPRADWNAGTAESLAPVPVARLSFVIEQSRDSLLRALSGTGECEEVGIT